MTPICPCCGYDLVKDEPVKIGDFNMASDFGPLQYKGKRVRLTAAQKSLCWSLMKAYPRPVRSSTLRNRIGSDADSNVLQVLVCRIRKTLANAGAPAVVKSIAGVGYAWELAE